MSVRILHVFNRYLMPGGEENVVRQIDARLRLRHPVACCNFESSDWVGPGAPSKLQQGLKLFYNTASRARFEAVQRESQAQVALFHNLYPVASPSLYKSAKDSGLPVVQFLHNYRPFSVSGTLYADGKMMPEALEGDFSREVMSGAWQGSVVKSALFALLLKLLQRSGWLGSISHWVAISEFMRQKLMQHAGIPAGKIVTLRHCWDALETLPQREDAGEYLFLGRLVEVKGITMLLQAWHELRLQLGERCPRLVIAGDGEQREEVEQACAVNPAIRYAGQLGGVAKAEALRTCRALLAPSTWWEPLGLVVYEAYDFGKPVIAARAGGLGETVQDGETGFHHEPGDVAALVQQVLSMEAMTAEQRLAMGDAGRAWLLTNASPQQWNMQMDQLLAEAASVGAAVPS